MDLSSLLHGAYVVAAVFGFGVMAIDMLGLLGDHDDGAGGHGHGHGGDGHHLSGDLDADGHHTSSGSHTSLLMLLSRLRLVVYFCVGFGGLGLAAEYTGSGLVMGLVWAVIGGALATFLARIMFRFQSRDVDSSLDESELLAQHAQVTVALRGTDMGKVRVHLGQMTLERYALCDDPADAFEVNSTVEIVRTSDECVYVSAVSSS